MGDPPSRKQLAHCSWLRKEAHEMVQRRGRIQWQWHVRAGPATPLPARAAPAFARDRVHVVSLDYPLLRCKTDLVNSLLDLSSTYGVRFSVEKVFWAGFELFTNWMTVYAGLLVSVSSRGSSA